MAEGPIEQVETMLEQALDRIEPASRAAVGPRHGVAPVEHDCMRRELVCTEPATPPRLEVRTREAPRPKAGQVLVRVKATAVNPIDAKRAAGYGRRLLGLKGAATFPLVLGNDLAGVVEAVGTGVSRFAPGQRVFGAGRYQQGRRRTCVARGRASGAAPGRA